MCDCYDHKCELCNKMLPIHIEDYGFRREELKVFCSKHIPKYNATIFATTTLFKYRPASRFRRHKDCEKPGAQIAISLRNGELEPETKGIYPNIYAYSDIEILPKKL